MFDSTLGTFRGQAPSGGDEGEGGSPALSSRSTLLINFAMP